MKTSKKEIFISAVVGFIGAALFVIKAVLSSKSSTAAIGFIFIPIYGAIAATITAISYSLLKQNWWTRIGFVIIAVILGFGFYDKYENIKSASDEKTPASYLIDLAQTKMLFGKTDVLVALAQNPSSPAELLKKLAKNSSIYVRNAVASNPQTPPEILADLSFEEYESSVHSRLAAHPKLPAKGLERLLAAKLSDFKSNGEYKLYQTYVLATLARNPILNDADFLKLTQLPNPEYFLIFGIIESGRASCELLRNYRDGDNGALKGNAESQMATQNCKN